MNNLLTELNQLIDLNPDVINPWNYYWDIKLFSKLRLDSDVAIMASKSTLNPLSIKFKKAILTVTPEKHQMCLK